MSDEETGQILIFLLSPYALTRSGLRGLINGEPGMKVVNEAGDEETALELVSIHQPDIILLRLNHAGDPNLHTIPKLLQKAERSRIILLVTSESHQLCSQAVQNGVVGIVPLTSIPPLLFKAIKKVHEGEVWLDHSLVAHLVNALSSSQRNTRIDPDADRIQRISARESQVIRFIGMGYKNKQIAQQLCISETTVRHHLTSIYEKLGVSDRLELLIFATRNGLTKQLGGEKNGTKVP